MSCTVLPYFARDKEHIKLYRCEISEERTLHEIEGLPFPLPTPRAAQWSPDGQALAIVDLAQGVQIIQLTAGNAQNGELYTLTEAPKTTQGFIWSPRGTMLVTVAPGSSKASQEPNLHVWRKAPNGTGYECQASFCHPKLERGAKVLQWTTDEAICARLCPDGSIHVLNGGNLAGPATMELTLHRAASSFEFAPLATEVDLQARLAVFMPDIRDDMQRVTGPATVTIWNLSACGARPKDAAAKAEVASGQISELLWNASGTALLAHCQTEVDESGQSYYGGSRLVFMSHDGEYQKNLTESDEGDKSDKGTSVQAVAWNPARDEFVLIHGFQPAQAALYSWDVQNKKVTMTKVLLEKAHRNTIRFNHFGSLLCLAGFGNLAGQIDFFGRVDGPPCDYVKVSTCQANCTVNAEWAPDGRHFLTAVLAPRMRVDNGIHVWRALSGTKVASMEFEELFDTQWRPERLGSVRFKDIPPDEVANASKELASKSIADGGEPKKQAYRPPRARGEGSSMVAAMMRGEVAAPDDDRRARKPRQQRQRDDDGGPNADSLWGEQQDRREKKDAENEGDHGPQAQPGSGHLPLQQQSIQPQGQPQMQQQQPFQQVPQQLHSQHQLQPLQTHEHPVRELASVASPTGQTPLSRPATQQQAPPAPAVTTPGSANVSRTTNQGHGTKLPCPANGWQYVDPKQNIQGPFTLLEMQQWNQMGYFRPELPMRCDPGDQFVQFGELFPHPLIPFQSYPKRPGRMR